MRATLLRRGVARAPIFCAAIFGAATFCAGASPVSAQDTGWVINGFRANYAVQPDGSVRVVERIAVDFQWQEKHGIYRTIPVEYRRLASTPAGPIAAGRIEIELDVEQVLDERGNEWPVETSREGDRMRIRIGDPDRTVTGRQVYEIHYTLERGVGFFDDHDELYWQVTGTEWPVPIERVSARVLLPPESAATHAGDRPWGAECYAGLAESTSGDRCQARVVASGEYAFEATDLASGEGLTFVATFPKGIIPGPTALQSTIEAILRYGPLLFPLITFVTLFALWWRRGREPAMGSIVPVWRPPDGLRPGPAGTLVDQRADMDDVVATILDLAVRGWIRIREVSPAGVRGAIDQSFLGRALEKVGVDFQDWEIERINQSREGLAVHEQLVLDGLLGGAEQKRLSKLNEKFYVHLPEIREALYDDLVRRGLFPRSPDATRKRWLLGGGIFVVLGVVSGVVFQHVILGLGLGLSGALVALFSFGMPAMTSQGARVRREVEGLEEYVRRAEKAELEFREAPEKTPEHFSQILPYAVALDVSDLWVKQFEPILRASPPAWYVGNAAGGWSSGGFRSSLSGFAGAASKTLAASPGSSSGGGGGGSVGGGGGGGGGGSW